MFIKKLLLTCLLLAASLNAKERITLYLDWINQFQFAGYYMAKEKGYYDKLGIDLEIVEYSNNHNVVNKVIENSSNYGIGKSSLIIDKFEGKNVILLSSFSKFSISINYT